MTSVSDAAWRIFHMKFRIFSSESCWRCYTNKTKNSKSSDSHSDCKPGKSWSQKEVSEALAPVPPCSLMP